MLKKYLQTTSSRSPCRSGSFKDCLACINIQIKTCFRSFAKTSNNEDKTEDEKKAIEAAIYMLLSSSNSKYAYISDIIASKKEIESATGTLKVEKLEDGTYTLTATGVDIKATYTSSDTTTNATLTLDGVIYVKDTTEEEKSTRLEKVTNLKQNGVQYKDIEYSTTFEKSTDEGTFSTTVTFTKALCGGKKVDLDILNKYWNTYY